MRSEICRRVYRVCCMTYIYWRRHSFDLDGSFSLADNGIFQKLAGYSNSILSQPFADQRILRIVYEFASVSKRKYLAAKCLKRLFSIQIECKDFLLDACRRFENLFSEEIILPDQHHQVERLPVSSNISCSAALEELEYSLVCSNLGSKYDLSQYPLYESALQLCFPDIKMI